jgi:hypothetical protein
MQALEPYPADEDVELAGERQEYRVAEERHERLKEMEDTGKVVSDIRSDRTSTFRERCPRANGKWPACTACSPSENDDHLYDVLRIKVIQCPCPYREGVPRNGGEIPVNGCLLRLPSIEPHALVLPAPFLPFSYQPLRSFVPFSISLDDLRRSPFQAKSSRCLLFPPSRRSHVAAGGLPFSRLGLLPRQLPGCRMPRMLPHCPSARSLSYRSPRLRPPID